jgi:tetratricopeptide (TPR) repeat protein
MGREHTRQGKHVHLFAAGLLIILLAGCSVLENVQLRAVQSERAREGREHLALSRDLLARGNFEEALRESQKVLHLASPRTPVDEALYTTGLIWVHPDNPKRDYNKAIVAFTSLQKDYPGSRLAAEAKSWTVVLLDYGKLEQSKERLEQAKERLEQAKEKLEQANEKLTQVIEKSRQVDIEVEEKKRERAK